MLRSGDAGGQFCSLLPAASAVHAPRPAHRSFARVVGLGRQRAGLPTQLEDGWCPLSERPPQSPAGSAPIMHYAVSAVVGVEAQQTCESAPVVGDGEEHALDRALNQLSLRYGDRFPGAVTSQDTEEEDGSVKFQPPHQFSDSDVRYDSEVDGGFSSRKRGGLCDWPGRLARAAGYSSLPQVSGDAAATLQPSVESSPASPSSPAMLSFLHSDPAAAVVRDPRPANATGAAWRTVESADSGDPLHWERPSNSGSWAHSDGSAPTEDRLRSLQGDHPRERTHSCDIVPYSGEPALDKARPASVTSFLSTAAGGGTDVLNGPGAEDDFPRRMTAVGCDGYHTTDDDTSQYKPLLRDMSYEVLPDEFKSRRRRRMRRRSLPDVCGVPGSAGDPDAGAGGASATIGSLSSEQHSAAPSQHTIRHAQYGGSFTVAGTDQAARAEYVRRTLHTLKEPGAGAKPVLLDISLHGIEVQSPDATEVYMSHALRRVSYATCAPASGAQFSFLAREPRGHLNLQYCHTFFTETHEQAEELNAIVSSAFRLAYAARLQQRSAAATGRGQATCPGDPVTSHTCCSTDGADKINNRTSWGRRSRHSSRRASKSVNLCPGGGVGADPGEAARPAPELRLLTGYANEAPTGGAPADHETSHLPTLAGRCHAHLSDSGASVRDDDRGSHWSGSGSGCGSTCSSQPEGADNPAPSFYRHQQGPTPEQVHLRHAAWFQAGIPREIALEVLSREPVGAFMVRESTTKHGCYALSLRVPRDFHVSGIAHYLILNTNKGYKIKGFMKEFTSLTALIVHHSVMPELLPCTLSLSRYHPEFARAHAAASAADMEELLDTSDSDYNGLSQLSSSATADTTV